MTQTRPPLLSHPISPLSSQERGKWGEVCRGVFCLLFAAFPAFASLSEFSAGVWTPVAGYANERAIVRTLQCFGIPFVRSARFSDLEHCAAILAAGPLNENDLDKTEIGRLYRYVEKGGHLFLAGEIGKSLHPLAGVEDPLPSQRRFRISLDNESGDPLLSYADLEKERYLRLGNPKLYGEVAYTFGAVAARGRKLAAFDDNSAALTVMEYGLGRVYYLGIGWDAAILAPQVGQDYEAQGAWINTFEPTTDMFMLLMKAFYESGVRLPLTIPAAPGPYRSALLLTHDIDARESFPNALEFARLERKFGVSATYFVCTKTFSDETDTAYFTPQNRACVRALDSLGFPIGSHSVSHFTRFDTLPAGSPFARIGDYDPLRQKTLFGECQVSRGILLDMGLKVESFRAGYLAYPRVLDSVLDACGYTLNSTFSANAIMCDFPFYSLRTRSFAAVESRVLQLPMTLDGDAPDDPVTPDNLPAMVRRFREIISANASNGAITTFMIHPTETGYKLLTVETLMRGLKDERVWIGDLETYAAFYRLRERIRIQDAAFARHTLFLTLSVPYEAIPPSFSLMTGVIPDLKRVVIRDHRGRRVSFLMVDEGSRLRLHGLGLDTRYYEAQRRLITAIGLLFILVITGLCGFLFVQRVLQKAGLKRARPKDHEEAVLTVLYSELKLAERARAVKSLGHPAHTRQILLEQSAYLKGELAADAAFVYKVLLFYREDLRRLEDLRWWKRAEAARNLGRALMAEAEAPLRPLLRDRNIEVRIAAVFALGRIGARRTLPEILGSLVRSDAWTARMMLDALLPLRTEAAEALRPMADDPDLTPAVRATVITALGLLRDPHAVPSLVKRLDDPDSGVCLAALAALQKIGDESILSRLALLFESPDKALRLAALRAVAGTGNPAALPLLLKLISVATPLTLREAIRALPRFGDRGLEALIGLADHENPVVAHLAIHGIEESGLFEKLADDLNRDDLRPRERADRFFRSAVQRGRTLYLDGLALEPRYAFLSHYHPVTGG